MGFCVNSPEAMRSSSVFARTGAHARRAWTRAGRPPTRSERAEAPPSARPPSPKYEGYQEYIRLPPSPLAARSAA